MKASAPIGLLLALFAFTIPLRAQESAKEQDKDQHKESAKEPVKEPKEAAKETPKAEGAGKSAEEAAASSRSAESKPGRVSSLLPLLPDGVQSVIPGDVLEASKDLTLPKEVRAMTDGLDAKADRSKTEVLADERSERVRFRQVQIRALNDPVVQEAKARAVSARTDRERRAALSEHYERLYAAMLKMDRSLEGRVKTSKAAALASFNPSSSGMVTVPRGQDALQVP